MTKDLLKILLLLYPPNILHNINPDGTRLDAPAAPDAARHVIAGRIADKLMFVPVIDALF